jgi:hypothetical protein
MSRAWLFDAEHGARHVLQLVPEPSHQSREYRAQELLKGIFGLSGPCSNALPDRATPTYVMPTHATAATTYAY